MDKTTFALGIILMLGGTLICGWYMGKDGVITTAILSMIGVIAGSILGFKFGKGE